MQAGTSFAMICLNMGMFYPILKRSAGAGFESPGGSSAPSLVPNATPTPWISSLSLVNEQTSDLFVFLPVQFGDLAVSALVDSGAIYNFLAASLLPKLRDSPSFVSIVPCQLQVTLADGGVVQAAQLASLAPRGGG